MQVIFLSYESFVEEMVSGQKHDGPTVHVLIDTNQITKFTN